MLYKVVVGVARKGEGIESERIHRWQAQQSQPRIRDLKMGQIEVDQIVAQREVRSFGEVVQPCQCCIQVIAVYGQAQRMARVSAHPGKGEYAFVPDTHLEVQGETTREWVAVIVRCHC